MAEYLIIIERTRNGFSAYAPDLPGCIAAGRTRAEVVQLMREAIAMHLADMRERGERPRKPRTESRVVRLHLEPA
jgi:predicted RNase H-like HicB family nuclease